MVLSNGEADTPLNHTPPDHNPPSHNPSTNLSISRLLPSTLIEKWNHPPETAEQATKRIERNQWFCNETHPTSVSPFNPPENTFQTVFSTVIKANAQSHYQSSAEGPSTSVSRNWLEIYENSFKNNPKKAKVSPKTDPHFPEKTTTSSLAPVNSLGGLSQSCPTLPHPTEPYTISPSTFQELPKARRSPLRADSEDTMARKDKNKEVTGDTITGSKKKTTKKEMQASARLEGTTA